MDSAEIEDLEAKAASFRASGQPLEALRYAEQILSLRIGAKGPASEEVQAAAEALIVEYNGVAMQLLRQGSILPPTLFPVMA